MSGAQRRDGNYTVQTNGCPDWHRRDLGIVWIGVVSPGKSKMGKEPFPFYTQT